MNIEHHHSMHNGPAAILLGMFYAAGVIIDERSLVPIGTACAIAGGIWWLGRKLQSLEDGLRTLEKGQTIMRDKIDNLPCHAFNGSCKKEK